LLCDVVAKAVGDEFGAVTGTEVEGVRGGFDVGVAADFAFLFECAF
jgi:hypothetical protein